MSVLVAGGMSLERIIAYNAAAFALQLPFGMVMDAFPRFNRICFFVGTGLTVSAAAAAIFAVGGWGVLVAAGVGNALFHLTAGKHVLETYKGSPGPAGLFISTGALGLAAGLAWAPDAAVICLSVSAAALAVCTFCAALKEWETGRGKGRGEGLSVWGFECLSGWGMSLVVVRLLFLDRINRIDRIGKGLGVLRGEGLSSRGAGNEGCGEKKGRVKAVLGLTVLVGLFILTAWRSWAGLLANARTGNACVAVVIAGAVAVLAGKIAGGYAAACAGRWKVAAVSVAGSAVLVFLCDPSMTLLWISLLFVSQLATGPVLSLIFDRTGRRGGTAFGLNCLGLFTGSIV